MDVPHRSSRRWQQRALVGLFCAGLLAPAVDMLARPVSARDPSVEGRAIAPLPWLDLQLQTLLELPEACERAFADRFGLRDVLLRLHSQQCLDLFGVAPTPLVLPGKQGWLFYTGERSVETWRGLHPFSEDELRAWQRGLEARREFVRGLGAEYAIAFGPNKESIYPDLMPDGFERLGPTRMDQLVEWMRAHSDVRLVDLRPALIAARAADTPQHHLYFEEGTHWHGRGCMVATQELLRQLATRFPALAGDDSAAWTLDSTRSAETWRTRMYLPVPRERVRDDWTPPGGTPHARLVDVANAIERDYAQQPPRPELPSVYLLHDSFGPGIERILAERVGRLRSKSTMDFDRDALVAEPPELVLELYVERMLVTRDPATLLPPADSGLAARQAAEAEARFGASQDVRWKLDPHGAAAQFETSGRLEIEPRNDGPAPGLLLHCGSATDELLLPAVAPRNDQDLVLRMEIDSSIATEARISYRSDERQAWSDARSVRLPLKAGHNVRWATLPASERVERLRLCPGETPGRTLLLRAFEVRGVE